LPAGPGFAEQLLEIAFGRIQRDAGRFRVGADALASDKRLEKAPLRAREPIKAREGMQVQLWFDCRVGDKHNGACGARAGIIVGDGTLSTMRDFRFAIDGVK
jgi:hypothetical protein